jgi:hypothetical protein
VAVPVKIGALIVSNKLVENISRFLAQGAIKLLDNMMLSSHEKGTIVNAPGVKNFGSPVFDTDAVTTRFRNTPIFGTQNYNGVNFLGVLNRGGGADIDTIVVGATNQETGRTPEWQQEFWWGYDPGDLAPINSEDDAKNNPYPSLGGNNHPSWNVPSGEVLTFKAAPIFWKHRGWKAGTFAVDVADFATQAYTMSIVTPPASGTLTRVTTWGDQDDRFTYDPDGVTTGTVTATIRMATAGFNEDVDITFEMEDTPDNQGVPVAGDKHFQLVMNSESVTPSLAISTSQVTDTADYWRETGGDALDSITIALGTGSVSYGTIAKTPSDTAGTGTSHYYPAAGSVGNVDKLEVTYNFGADAVTANWYVWITPEPGLVEWNTIHSLDTPSTTNAKGAPVGLWSHASMNGDTYFMNGAGTFGTLSTKEYWTCKTLTPSTVTTSIGKTAPIIFPASTITSVTIIDGGSGYTADDLTFTTDPQGAGSGATGNYTVAGGVIDSTAITSGGSGYTKPPAVTGDSGGSGAILKPVITDHMTYSSTTSAGAVRGVVRYKVSWVTDGLESPLSKDYLEVSLDGLTNTVTISNVPTTTVTGDTTRLYRTEAGRKQYYFLDYVPYVGGRDPYTDTTDDLELGDFPQFHGEPPPENGMCPIVYYDRMWCLGGTGHNTLYWSDLNEPQSWSMDSNYADIYANDNDYGTCLVRDYNGLLVFKSNHIYRLAGRTPSDMVLSELTLSDGRDVSLGCPHIGALASTPEGLFFYWKGAIYKYRAGKVNRISEDIDPTLNRIISNHEDQIYLGYWPNESLLFCSFGRDNFSAGSESTWGVTYIYNLSERAWIGRMLGFYGPYANLTISPDANIFESPRKWKTTLCAGSMNSVAHNTKDALKYNAHHNEVQVVWFDNSEPELGATKTTGISIGGDADISLSTTASEDQGRRRLEFQPFYGEPKERNRVKRFLYTDIIVTDTSSVFAVEFDVDEATTIRSVDYDVITNNAGYTVYRAYLGVIGWKLTVRVDFKDGNIGQMAFLGGSIGYQTATDKGVTAIPPVSRVA